MFGQCEALTELTNDLVLVLLLRMGQSSSGEHGQSKRRNARLPAHVSCSRQSISLVTCALKSNAYSFVFFCCKDLGPLLRHLW